jgi:Flp pilus assembly protein CpaB
MKNKTIIIVIVLVLMLAIGGYLFWKLTISPQTAEDAIFSSLGENANPMANKPDINPVDVSNPFRSIKTNPFK